MLWINVSWLQQLGLQIPKTTDDLIKVLKDFRENDPNSNGRKDENKELLDMPQQRILFEKGLFFAKNFMNKSLFQTIVFLIHQSRRRN